MATTKFGPNAGRSYSISSMLTSDAGATLQSGGLNGLSDSTTIEINNVSNGATATTFTITEQNFDGNARTITTLAGIASASVTLPNAVPTTNGQGIFITLTGPISVINVTLGGAAPTGQIYVEIKEATWRTI